jgi:plasmid stabilization system protein ParE
VNKILFHELAGKELLDARDYYDDLVFGLGKKFIVEIERCLSIIKANPLAYPSIRENVRKAVVIKFPFSILYRVDENAIYILAVMHQKRKPRYWAERI